MRLPQRTEIIVELGISYLMPRMTDLIDTRFVVSAIQGQRGQHQKEKSPNCNGSCKGGQNEYYQNFDPPKYGGPVAVGRV